MADEKLYKKLKEKFLRAKENRTDWHDEAVDSFNMYHGNQWTDDDKRSMRCSGRPHLTFNNIQPFINAISGSEIGNKQVVKYYPREPGELKAEELLTAVADWFRESTMGDEVDTAVFKDSLICGMGWSETTLDFTSNPDGDPRLRRLDPLKMYWDDSSLEDNLRNARYLFYVNALPLEDLKELFPKADEAQFKADNADEDEGDAKGTGSVIEARYKVKKKFVRYTSPLDGTQSDVSKEDFDKFQKATKNSIKEFKEYNKELIERAFLGSTEFLEPPALLSDNNSLFGWNVVTGYCDNIRKQYYGTIKGMKDAQLCINKFFSESVHNYNAQGKGGVFVEEGALLSKEQFANTLTRPDQITFLQQGGLSKIRNKPIAQISPVLPSLIGFAENQMNQVIGVSKEFLGTREINQPGVLEQQRRQSTLNILAPLFENLKAYRAAQGRDILFLIQNYLSDGRLVKIVGPEKSQYIPLAKEALKDKEYDVIVDDAPLSLNSQERDYTTVMQMMPLLGNHLTPELLIEVMKLSALPADFIDKAEQALASSQPDPNEQAQQKQQQQMIMNVQQQKAMADIAKNHAQASKDIAQADKNNSLTKLHDIQAAAEVSDLVRSHYE